MERSATKTAIRPLFPSKQVASKSYDARILFVSACVAIGVVIAIYALMTSAPMDPTMFGTMVAFP